MHASMRQCLREFGRADGEGASAECRESPEASEKLKVVEFMLNPVLSFNFYCLSISCELCTKKSACFHARCNRVFRWRFVSSVKPFFFVLFRFVSVSFLLTRRFRFQLDVDFHILFSFLGKFSAGWCADRGGSPPDLPFRRSSTAGKEIIFPPFSNRPLNRTPPPYTQSTAFPFFFFPLVFNWLRSRAFFCYLTPLTDQKITHILYEFLRINAASFRHYINLTHYIR